jgi:hypothetical protein
VIENPESAPSVPSPRPTAKRPVKTKGGRGRLLKQQWWPLEVAIVWVATGDVDLCEAAFQLVIERRASPAARCPSLSGWVRTYESRSTLYEATPGGLYRKQIRESWKPGDHHGLHPIERAMDETAKILRGHLQSRRGRTSDTRRLSRGIRNDPAGDDVRWIPTRAWSNVNLVDHRKWGVIILALDDPKSESWRNIEVLAEPFKALGADRGRKTIAQRRQAPTNNERIQRKLANHDRKMGRPAKKRRGRPKGSTNVQH